MEVSKNFDLEEFLPPEIYKQFGKNGLWFIDKRIIDLAQFYRDYFDASVTINNWSYYKSGQHVFRERGYREPDSKTGASKSQHKFGRAFDCDIKGITADEARKEILKFEEEFMEMGLTTLEMDVNWLHSDVRWTGKDKIFKIYI